MRIATIIHGVKTEVITAQQQSHRRLFYQGKEITDSTILASYSKEGKGSSTKHFVVIHDIKTEVMTANQLTKNRLFHQSKEITDAAILATHSKEGKGNSIKHFVVINGIKTEVFNKKQLKRRQFASQQREDEWGKRARLQIPGEESVLTDLYDQILAGVKGL
ncbi:MULTISPECIES: hypothetical protein [Legionella]|uniref:Ubiquitin-like domain-containing protein n=1 Tax=Legionella maceachernii TaxID=466 RepID=A0A0W0WGL5_9GAMM|nr:hypothetical protein [Legionella maceachernii]KTD31489.1 hypothetical protein Lmac_0237 [Legionella maceachernii]SJZ94730.1 hypothetical protein SAMN02745128_01546 [Legionella maceachernii]SUP03353.1 Uncharacterised protein [Legionella maceachernii]